MRYKVSIKLSTPNNDSVIYETKVTAHSEDEATELAYDELESLCSAEVELTNEEKVTYQVWLFGRGEDYELNDWKYFIREFDDPSSSFELYYFISRKGISSIKSFDEKFFLPADVYSVDLHLEIVTTLNYNSEDVETWLKRNIKIK